mgnify:CR=1 FL=1
MSTPAPTFDLRHTLATVAYRAEKVLRGAPAGFGEFRASPQSRPAIAIVAHLGDLMEWGERMARNESRWQPIPQPSWEAAVARFFGALAALDAAVASGHVDGHRQAVLFQGQIGRAHV